MTDVTPGERAYQAHYQNPAMDFRTLGAPEREHWEGVARAAITDDDLRQAVGQREALRKCVIRYRESIWTLVGQLEAGEIKTGPETAATLRRLLGFG